MCRRRELHKVHTTQKAVVTWETFKNVSYVPPFSVFDARQGYWQKRKKEWREAGLKSDDGRDTALIGKGLKKLADVRGMNLTGTSVFDPMLCEVLYNWYSPPGGIVFDPFAGGSVRGKTVKVHQNVLVFYKGDMRKIRDNFGTDFSFVDLSRFSKE